MKNNPLLPKALGLALSITAMFTSCTSHRSPSVADDHPLLLLVGSYNPADQEAIGVYRFDQQTGQSTKLQGFTGVGNPSFLCTNQAQDLVYAVSEYDAPEQTMLHSLRLDKTSGQLSLLTSVCNNAAAPCNVTLSPDQQFAVCSNYTAGSFTIFPLGPGSAIGQPTAVQFQGSGPHPNQNTPHIHAINFTPDGRYLMANDLGLDCIHVYPVSEASPSDSMPIIDLAQGYDVKVDPGAGPRHLCWSPDGRFAYLLSELSGQIYTLSYADDKLQVVSSLVADTIGGGGSADIHLTSDGQWLYASHRLQGDGISIYHVDTATGALQRVGYQNTGIHPRNFTLTPNDRYLLCACRDSDVIQIFERDAETGLLTDTGRSISFAHPVFVKLL